MNKSATYQSKNNSGFTIIELLIATAVFSLMLVIFLSVFIQIGRLFYKGVAISNNQESARNVVQSISDDIRFTKNQPVGDLISNQGYFCIGQHRYLYTKYFQVGSGAGYGVQRQDLSDKNCSPPAQDGVPPDGSHPVAGSGFEMLSAGMQLNNISVDCHDPSLSETQSCLIRVVVVFYGDDNSVFQGVNGYLSPNPSCQGSLTGNQFCSVADYRTTVLQN
jgi:prepilin-type N-terminal cleavage/methylation domain-containing protein